MATYSLNVTASARLLPIVSGELAAALEISVCNGVNGKPYTDLTQKYFTLLKTMVHDGPDLDVNVLDVIELSKRIPGYPAGIYEISLQTPGGFHSPGRYTFIIQVKWSSWFNTLQGQAVAGVGYWPNPA